MLIAGWYIKLLMGLTMCCMEPHGSQGAAGDGIGIDNNNKFRSDEPKNEIVKEFKFPEPRNQAAKSILKDIKKGGSK